MQTLYKEFSSLKDPDSGTGVVHLEQVVETRITGAMPDHHAAKFTVQSRFCYLKAHQAAATLLLTCRNHPTVASHRIRSRLVGKAGTIALGGRERKETHGRERWMTLSKTP